jgi:hypothetical protein
LVGSTGLVVRRADSHAGVLLTAMFTALAVGTLLVSAVVLAPGVAESAFRQTIADSGADDIALTASTALDAPTWSATDAAVRQAAAREPQLEAQVTAAAWTTAFCVPGANADTRVAVGSVEAQAERAQLSEGRWATPGAEVLEVTVQKVPSTLSTSRLGTGSSLTRWSGPARRSRSESWDRSSRWIPQTALGGTMPSEYGRHREASWHSSARYSPTSRIFSAGSSSGRRPPCG